MKEQRILYILLTYYPKEKEIMRIIHSLSPCNVVIVDNTPNNESNLKPIIFPSFAKYLPQSKNLGYDGGVNVGFQYGMQHGFDWMIILNDDITLSQKDFVYATKQLQLLKSGIAGPKIGTLDPMRFSTIFKKSNANITDPYAYVSGAFLAIHRDVIISIGMMYEPYFIYFEDCDYSMCVKKAGFPIFELRLNTFYHQESKSIGQKSFLKEYYHARNHLLFIERHAPMRVKIHELVRMPKSLLEFWKQRNIGAITGIKDFALRRFGQYKRNV
jgi:GT2 family glycosyltransferase